MNFIVKKEKFPLRAKDQRIRVTDGLSSRFRTGGIIPHVAQALHRQHIARIVQEALEKSGLRASALSAVATTVKPGLALSLSVGLEFTGTLLQSLPTPFIPVHHMEAHALTVRMVHPLPFPFLVLLVSGGHALLALARGVSDFLLLGQGSGSPGGPGAHCCHAFSGQIARRLSLTGHPECRAMGGGQAVEHLALQGDRLKFNLRTPMGHRLDCNFSFAGLRTQVERTIGRLEQEEGVRDGRVLSCVADVCAAAQHAVCAHIAKRTHRAILFCKARGLLPERSPTLVASGGVASNRYARQLLQVITDASGLELLCPPPRLCTDNGAMVAWNGIERLREGIGILPSSAGIRYQPKATFGTDISEEVKQSAIILPPVKLRLAT
ncbi:probable tRNA N6-adenosine threonylcarbamoyltransferase, mitochondrial [Polypterus senegalus]|uniref:probable tRNA N6-adenosine threonylcarbamoyltransferase, mitochondrial n=1 Tax=Polypterus senegalus TaxID=55291 RepID=UPI001966BC9A|nr:probable tRNA N6-adenosine threonylcarbamoyltransferase, mitochondrial [Polypterus senegalus]